LEKNKHIEELKDQIRRGREMTKTKEQSIIKVSQEIVDMGEKSKETTKEIEEMNQSNMKLLEDLKELVQVNVERSLQVTRNADDPIKLLATYIENCK
jgi:hypothetical protein